MPTSTPRFTAHWKKKSDGGATIQQSPGGSGKQARSVIDGLPADVLRVTLFTIDELFGGWAKAQQGHFADGGTFDRVYRFQRRAARRDVGCRA
jgi:ABC-type sulfate transport system substrate-binding protein